MLTQLSTIKARLGIDEFDLSSDAILTNAINGISVRFDKETNRTLPLTRHSPPVTSSRAPVYFDSQKVRCSLGATF
jgi:hypothetical protein